MKNNLGLIFLISIIGSAFFTGAAFISTDQSPEEVFNYPSYLFGSVSALNSFFISTKLAFIPVFMGLNITLLCFIIFLKLQKETLTSKISSKHHFWNFTKVFIGVMAIEMILWVLPDLGFLILFFLAPLILFWVFTAYFEQISLSKSFNRTSKLVAGNYGTLLGLFAMLLFSGLFFFSLADTAVFSFFFSILSWVIHFEQETMNSINAVIQTFLLMTFLNLVISSIIIGIGIAYYSLLESNDALHLLEKIKAIGLKRRIKGLERE